MIGTSYPDVDTPDPHEFDLLDLVKSGDWLDAQEFPPLQWAVFGLIPEGFGLLTGPPKAGKSWCAFGVGLAIATGGHAFGKVPTGDARPVLYLALEDGNARLQWRARQLLEDAPIPALLHSVTSAHPDQVVPLIRAWLDRYGHLKPLVLLDTLGKVMPPSMPGESAYQRDYRIGSKLKSLADAHPGSTLLVIHHIRKAAGEDWMDSTSGTNGLNGAADFTINLHRARNSEAGLIRVTGRDVAESEFAVTSVDGRWTLDGSTLAEAAQSAVTAKAVADLGDKSAEVVTFVNRNPQGTRAADVAEACGMETHAARTYLSRLAESGRIYKTARGLYTPVASVASVAFDGETQQLQRTQHEFGGPQPKCDCHGRVFCPGAAA